MLRSLNRRLRRAKRFVGRYLLREPNRGQTFKAKRQSRGDRQCQLYGLTPVRFPVVSNKQLDLVRPDLTRVSDATRWDLQSIG